MNRPATRPTPVMALIRAAAPLLGPSERRVARAIVERPEAVVEWSTAELAAKTGTSPATVIRACQSLGFQGFQHLRLELARSAPEPVRPADDPLDMVFDDAVDAVVAVRESIDRHAFDRAVEALVGARRLLLVGTGFSGPPAQDAAMRFVTGGRTAEAPVDVLAQQFAARTLGKGDVCLAVSYSGANAHTLHACRAAVGGGATLVAVTTFLRSPLTRITDVVLATGPVRRSHDVDPFLGRLGQSIVLHALHQAVLAHPRSAHETARMRDVVAEAIVDDEP